MALPRHTMMVRSWSFGKIRGLKFTNTKNNIDISEIEKRFSKENNLNSYRYLRQFEDFY